MCVVDLKISNWPDLLQPLKGPACRDFSKSFQGRHQCVLPRTPGNSRYATAALRQNVIYERLSSSGCTVHCRYGIRIATAASYAIWNCRRKQRQHQKEGLTATGLWYKFSFSFSILFYYLSLIVWWTWKLDLRLAILATPLFTTKSIRRSARGDLQGRRRTSPPPNPPWKHASPTIILERQHLKIAQNNGEEWKGGIEWEGESAGQDRMGNEYEVSSLPGSALSSAASANTHK